jgi:hypothetical protein
MEDLETMPRSRIQVVGLDPAPSAWTYGFSGEPFRKRPCELRSYLMSLQTENTSILLCWDAPLTGPVDPDSSEWSAGDNSQRLIERFFSRQEWGFKAPKGISILGYAGCPHWSITRNLLGLPRVGRWDKSWDELPFELTSDDSAPIQPGHYVVEVHPALALWLWCEYIEDAWTGKWL